METLVGLREGVEAALRSLQTRALPAPFNSAEVAERLRQQLRILALLEKYAPEMVQREAEEREPGERKVRVTFTAAEARAQLDPDGQSVRGEWTHESDEAWRAGQDKLDAALKSLDPPETQESSDREDEG